MIGVIWVVQLVHYPLFGFVPPDGFATFEREHQQRMARVVVPFMLLELGTACALPFLESAWWTPLEAWAGLALLLLVWISTFALQAPAHKLLSKGFDSHVHKKLLQTNWIRTILWTVRGVLVLIWFFRATS